MKEKFQAFYNEFIKDFKPKFTLPGMFQFGTKEDIENAKNNSDIILLDNSSSGIGEVSFWLNNYQGKTFSMAGEKYSNGFSMQYSNQYALFNLNSKYSNIEFTVGHYDTGTSKWSNDQTVTFFVDSKVVKEITIGAEDMPKTISVPVQYGLQLKIMTGDTFYSYIGFGNVTVR